MTSDDREAGSDVPPAGTLPPERATREDLAVELENIASEIAIEAAELVGRSAERSSLDVDAKKSPNDLVTDVDRAAEALIVGRLAERRPDDAVLGEEGTNRPGTSGVRWVIDPIDGTTNFVYRFPGFAVSIAAEIEGSVVAGAVMDPTADALFTARAGGPATRNGQVLSIGDPPPLGTALIGTGFNADLDLRRRQATLAARLLPEIRDLRRRGAASTDLCSVACGELDAYYEEGLSPWDHAAGALIAERAGAKVGDLEGGPAGTHFVLVAPEPLFVGLRSALLEFGALHGGR